MIGVLLIISIGVMIFIALFFLILLVLIGWVSTVDVSELNSDFINSGMTIKSEDLIEGEGDVDAR